MQELERGIEEYVPAAHGIQVETDDATGAVENVPAGHAVQLEKDVAPIGIELKPSERFWIVVGE